MTVVTPSHWRIELQQALLNSFDREGLDLLCFGFDVTEDNAPSPAYKAMRLIKQMEKRQRLNDLLDACQRLRPTASWYNLRPLLPQFPPTVPLSERFSAKIEPEILSGEGQCEVTIYNEGTHRTRYTISGHDPAIPLNFSEGQGRQKIVSPGRKKRVSLHISPKKRPLIGNPQPYPFAVQISTPTHNLQSIEGQIIVKPLLPLWTITIWVVLFFLLLIGGLWAINRPPSDISPAVIAPISNTATATSSPTRQPIVPEATSTAVRPTHTAVPAATATTISPTATPDFAYSEITDIHISEEGIYLVNFITYNFRPDRERLHVHFFFNTVSPENAGVPGSGWRLYAGPSPFSGYSLSDRPSEADEICILVANGSHHIRPDSGNCVPLP